MADAHEDPKREIRGWKEISQALGKSWRTAMRYADPTIAAARGEKRLPVYLVGNEVAIVQHELDAWQASRRRAYRSDEVPESVDIPLTALAAAS